MSAFVAGNPSAIAAGTAGKGPLDSSIAIRLGDMATSTTGADSAYNTMIVTLGTAAKDVQTRDNIQQSSVLRASMRPGMLKPGSTPTKR